jgi:hypothetical protein
MRKKLFALIVGAALSTWSTSAWALAYTISSSVAFSTNGVSGTINPVTSLTGTTICLTGTCTNSVAQDWLLVSVTLNGGSDPVDQIDVSASGVTTVVGVGHFSDPDVTPVSGSIQGTTSIGRYNYGNPNVNPALNLDAGETTDRLFVAFSPVGSLPGPGIPPVIPPGTASFMIGEAGSTSFSVSGSIVVVPEPTTALLLGGGLLGLALAGRRRA